MNNAIKHRVAALGSALLLTIAAPAQTAVLDPFQANYSVARGNLTLGTADFSITPWRDGECRVYHGVATPRAIVRLFVGNITDHSYLCPDGDGGIRPQRFKHVESGDEQDSYTLDFDWSASEVTYKNKKTFALPNDAVDPFSLHVAARLWLSQVDELPAERDFTIVDEDETKTYRLAASRAEPIETPVGTFDTVKLERVDDPDRRLIFWAAPELDYLPIRVERRKKDDPVIRMDLTALPQAPGQSAP